MECAALQGNITALETILRISKTSGERGSGHRQRC